MKKMLSVLLILAMTISLQACSDHSVPYPAADITDSEIIASLEGKVGNIAQMEAGADRIAVLRTDGSVVCVEGYCSGEPVYANLGWTDIVKIDVSGSAIVGLRADGVVLAAGRNMKNDLGIRGDNLIRGSFNCVIFDSKIQNDVEIPVVDIAACTGRVIALWEDGTVQSTNVQDQLSSWNNIVDIDTMHSAFGNKIFGVRQDGTVMESGSGDSAYVTTGWTDIVDICAGWSSVAGLKSDGTVVISQTPELEGNMGASYDTVSWTGIVELSGYSEIVGLKSDGTVVSTGLNEAGAGNVQDWYNVADVAAGEYFTVALKRDGSIVGTSQTENWNLSMLYG